MARDDAPLSGGVTLNSSTLGTALQSFLTVDEIQPGATPSYQAAKTIYEYHPLGSKLARFPIKLAQSQKREISVAIPGLEDALRDAFETEWKRLGCNATILNLKTMSRVYGLASVCLMSTTLNPMDPVDYFKLPDIDIGFNVLDPLNTAGSLVLDQNPNSPTFQKVGSIAIAGTPYHRSRAIVVMHGDPIYISFTSSAYGFVGRSVYQPCLFPLKSFVASMVTDDMVVKKAGLLIAMIKTVSSAVDRLAKRFGAFKRDLLKMAETNNVLQVGESDKIETLNMQNLDGAFGMARQDILENIAAADDMPAIMLNSETFAKGLAVGSEDAKYVAHYIDRIREEMEPEYAYFDLIVMHRAWSPGFFATLKKRFPELLSDTDYKTFFYDAKNCFKTKWPSLLTEPDSEKSKAEKVKLEGIISFLEVILPIADPQSKADALMWAAQNMNDMKSMFTAQIELNFEAIATYEPPQAEPLKEPGESPTMHMSNDSQDITAEIAAAIARISPPARAVMRKMLTAV